MSDAKRGRGFRSIGDLASGIADTPTMPVTTTAGSSVKLRISSTTTPPTETSSPITPPHGPRGLTALPGSLRAMAQGNDPAATDRNLLACLEPLLSLSEKRDWNISDPTRIGELSGFLIRHDASETDIRQAEELIAVSITPLAPQALMAELVRLRALTVSRQTGDDDTAAILAAYASELSQEPGDIVRAALRSRPGGKFWPAYEEVEAAMARLGSTRRMLAAAVKNRSFAENPAWPRWLEEIYGPPPEGPELRRARFSRDA